MDIRVAAYRPVTVTSTVSGGQRTTTANNAAQSAPVSPVAAVQQSRSNNAFNAKNFAATETRGTRVNILV
ncbi:MAG: hypothetical protein GC129_05450 [Proteobacteria bacterium]|nr:hypothetical protein [Pseudomonadota bacterium]